MTDIPNKIKISEHIEGGIKWDLGIGVREGNSFKFVIEDAILPGTSVHVKNMIWNIKWIDIKNTDLYEIVEEK